MLRRNICSRQMVYSVILGVLMMMVGGLCLMTVYSSDDYWYSTFFDDGIGTYLLRLAEHYRTFNGRVWVHILAHILLYAGNWLFALVCCCAVVVIPMLIGHAGGLCRERRWMAAALFAIGFAAMPTTFFVEGVMWISAFCNYLIPTAMLCVLLWQMERDCAMPWLLLTAFLCGSATEQMGFVVLALLTLYTLADARKRGKRLAGLLSALVGWGTVWASPATRRRTTIEVPIYSAGGIIDRVEENLQMISVIITGEIVLLLLLGALLILSGRFMGEHKRFAVRIGYAAGLCTLGLWFLSVEFQIIGCISALVVLGLFALWMLLRGHYLPGGLILAALASIGVMLFTSSISSRNLLPFYVLMLAAACFLVQKLLPERWEKAYACTALVLLAVTMLGMYPLAEGVVYNYRLDQQNRQMAAQAEETDAVYYDVGYDLRHTYTKAHHSQYGQEKYLEAVGLRADMGFVPCRAGKPLPRIRVGETELNRAVFPCAGGVDLFPLCAVVEAAGGTVDLSLSCMEVELDGIRCRLYRRGVMESRAEWTDEYGIPHRMNLSWNWIWSDLHVDCKLLTEVFNLDVTLDADGQFCIIGRG